MRGKCRCRSRSGLVGDRSCVRRFHVDFGDPLGHHEPADRFLHRAAHREQAVVALPERSHPVDRLSAAHFTQLLEKDRHRFQPVAVAIDHQMFEAGVYFSGAIFHRHGSSLF